MGTSKKRRRMGGVAACLNNLTIETKWTEKEAADNLLEMLAMETEEEGGNAIEGEKGGDETMRSLGDL